MSTIACPPTELDATRAALALRDRGKQEQALQLLDLALKRWPSSARLYQTEGLLHRSVGQSAEAMQSLARAARLAPTDAKIAHAIARVTLEAGLPASRLFMQARSMAPQDGSILLGLAAARLAEGAAELGIAELEAAVAGSPAWIEGHDALANLRWLSGRVDSFAASYEIALAKHAQNHVLWSALINRWMLVERFDVVLDLVDAARRACGDRVELLVSEAAAASETGEHDRADQLFELLRGQTDLNLVVRHIRHLLRTGRTREAAERGEPLLQGDLANHVWPYMGVCWRLLGDRRLQWLEAEGSPIRTIKLFSSGEAEQLAAVLRPLHTDRMPPLGQSVRGGTQTDGPLFARIDPEIRRLRVRIEEALSAFVADPGPPDARHPVLRHRGRRLRFAGSWSVRLTGAGHHSNHIHPQGWFSSALHIAVPEMVSDTGARAGWLTLGAPPAELGIDLPPVREIEPLPGQLILFPSIMWHGTRPFPAGERMSVAFDIAHPVA